MLRKTRLETWTRSATSAAMAIALPAMSLLSLSVVGCATDADVAVSDEDLTNVANTAVKNQSIGNCWVYASVGWAESLVLSSTGNSLNLSESYISYWHWYEEIAGGNGGTQVAALDNGQIAAGGYWGVAGELMLRYGIMDEGAFIPEEAEAARSVRQSAALSAINASLKTGALSTAAARKDRALVRSEMDKAWQLTPEVTAKLDLVFGKSVSMNLYKSKKLPTGMRHPREMPAGYVLVAGQKRTVWLDEAIGKPVSSYNFINRSGTYAWRDQPYPSTTDGRRKFQIAVQQSLHYQLPVIAFWFVDFAAMGSDKAFKAPPATPGSQGGHMTVLEDYEVKLADGTVLKAGVDVTDPKLLQAALDPKAEIQFFRIKNSWGSGLAPQGAAADYQGFHDLYMAYLNGPLKECTGQAPNKCATTKSTAGMRSVILPPVGYLTGK